jgi:hypothetical protein
VGILLSMKFPSTMKPAAPLGCKVRQGMTRKERWREGAECSKNEIIMFHIKKKMIIKSVAGGGFVSLSMVNP